LEEELSSTCSCCLYVYDATDFFGPLVLCDEAMRCLKDRLLCAIEIQQQRVLEWSPSGEHSENLEHTRDMHTVVRGRACPECRIEMR
jgi:hypothetical protein